MGYVKKQPVREEAGFQHIEDFIELSGVRNGVNRSFYAPEIPIVDNNRDDEVTIADLVVRVDGSNVSIDSVVPDTGEIVLTLAPAADTTVTARYAHSQLPDDYIDELIAEADSLINGAIGDYVSSTPLAPSHKHFPTARLISRLYAGGLALTRDYGANADTEETSKDGYKKLERAQLLLWGGKVDGVESVGLVGELKNEGSSAKKGGAVSVRNRGAIFPGTNFNESPSTSVDEFMRH
jgi:hypothetical protein